MVLSFNHRTVTEAELRKVLQVHFRRFVSEISLEADPEGGFTVHVTFAESERRPDDSRSAVSA